MSDTTLQNILTSGNNTDAASMPLSDNSLRIFELPNYVGYWTIAENRKEAKNGVMQLHLSKVPPRITRWFLSLFKIYWVKL